MSNENSNLRVGSAGAGLFVGSTEILGSSVNNILKYQDDFKSTGIVFNLTDKPVSINYVIDDTEDVYTSLLPGEAIMLVASSDNSNIFCDIEYGKGTYIFRQLIGTQNGLEMQDVDTDNEYLFDIYGDLEEVHISYILQEIDT